MVVTPELRAQILRLYLADQWRIGTIARQLHLHRDTVRRVLAVSSVLCTTAAMPPRLIDPFMPFIQETLAKFPTLAASRLHAMVQERGYGGGSSHFRHLVAPLRPRPVAEAYLRLRTLAGEQAQVDWAHMGYVMVGKAKRPLMAFVMVLSYSRRIFLHFSLNAQMDSFLRGHVLAFEAWGGVPRVILSDNLKSAVLERMGDAIRFNPQYLAFAAHYRFEPRPVAVARGNEYGVVKNMSRWISIAPALPLKSTFLSRHNFCRILVFHQPSIGEYHVRGSLYATEYSCCTQFGSVPGIEEAIPAVLSGTGLSANVDPQDRLDPVGFLKEHGFVSNGSSNARGNRFCGRP